ILLPLLIFGFYALMIYFQVKTGNNTKIAIVDKANIFNGKFQQDDEIEYKLVGTSITTPQLNELVDLKKFDGYLVIPQNFNPNGKDTLQLSSGKSLGIMTREKIQGKFEKILEEQRLLALNVSKSELDSIQNGNKIKFANISGQEDTATKVGISYGVGFASAMLIYMLLFIYGSMVMRGVMEEKTSRIAEVIVSSVKPFQLMMGKITGIGAVGILQFIIWIVLVIGLQMILLPILFPELMHHASQVAVQPAGVQAAKAIQDNGGVGAIMEGLKQVNIPMIIGCFVFYFLGGYLLYSSLFAAVGSAVNEDPQDAQSLMLPIMMPIIFAIVIMTKAVNEPTSGLAVFGSLFPLTSPIVMMARIAYGVPDTVPYWQLALSAILLIAGFLGTTWVAGKIYRTGILMYGKKITWKEMIKWVVRKN
ncbi:MAG: ABC transporter permease, partial [Bacteroidota bacterium]